MVRAACQPVLWSRLSWARSGKIVRHGSVRPARRRALAAATTGSVGRLSSCTARLAVSVLPGAAHEASPDRRRASVGCSR